MKHFFFVYNAVSILSGLIAVCLSGFLYAAFSKNKLYLYRIALLLAFFIHIIPQLFGYYSNAAGLRIAYWFYILQPLSEIFFFASIILYANTVSDVPFQNVMGKAVKVMSLVFVLLYPVLLFTGNFSLSLIYTVFLGLALVYAAFCFIFFHRNGDPSTRVSRLLNGIILAAFIPFFFVIDMFLVERFSFLSEFSMGSVMVPLYYIIFSCLCIITDFGHLVKLPLTAGAGIKREDMPDDFGLSVREFEVLQLILSGKSYQSIADELYISKSTVKTHVARIYQKCNVNSKMQLANKIFK
jgi:DNA-binding CsgD family transcriptional regulator